MIDINSYLEKLRSHVNEITVNESLQRQQLGSILIDIREKDEVNSGSPQGALRISKGLLEMNVDQNVSDVDREIMLICASGRRSLLAASSLLQMGYKEVVSVKGGFNEWKNQALPFEIPQALNEADLERYKRHLLIPEIGEVGQIKLLKSKVLVVGAGGIGSPVALYLAAAGIGTIGIVDDDIVDKTNLQRQILHTDNGVGTLKVLSAKERLQTLNPTINIITFSNRLNCENIEDIIKDFDIVVDGTDNFTTRYLINDACVKLKIPNVHGSVFRFEGQVSTFWPASNMESAPCYRCVYPSPPPPELAPSCAEAGVLGVLPGMVGVMCATEVIKNLVGFGNTLVGKLLCFNASSWEFDTYEIEKNKQCPYCNCVHVDNYPAYSEYSAVCTI